LRTNIVLDDALLAEAMRRTGLKTKRAVVEEALKTLVRLKRQEEIRKLRGKLHWEGDLDEMLRD
jgi:Arc/MetJ family transcription regulator